MRHSLLIFSVLALGLHSFSQPSHQRAIIRSTGVKRPNIVVLGANLSKVEIWAIPTGTGIMPDEYILLGTANRRNAAGHNEVWAFPYPFGSFFVMEILVKVFESGGLL